MIFIDNKYTKYYYTIINHAKSRNLLSRKQAKLALGYVEKHHIIPKACTGDNSKENLIFLSGREHFICHLLLTKMTIGDEHAKMVYAVKRMLVHSKKHDRYSPSSRIYNIVKKEFALSHSEKMTGRVAWNKGLKTGATMSKQQYQEIADRRRGKPLSDEWRNNMSKGHIGAKRGTQSATHRANVSRSLAGKDKSEIHKENLKKAWVKRRAANATLLSKD
jgi:hypothetical protein